MIQKFVEAYDYCKDRENNHPHEFFKNSDESLRELKKDYENLSLFPYALSIVMEADEKYGFEELRKEILLSHRLDNKRTLHYLNHRYFFIRRIIAEAEGKEIYDDMERLAEPTNEVSEEFDEIGNLIADKLANSERFQKMKRGELPLPYPLTHSDYRDIGVIYISAAEILSWENQRREDQTDHL